MILLPLHTPILRKGDDVASLLAQSTEFFDGDILVVSSKAIATCEGTTIDLATLTISPAAETWSAQSGQDPRFTQAILNETTRMNGNVVNACPSALLTELRPEGLKTGRLLVPNAGLDTSNCAKNHAIGWPHDPVASARHIRDTFPRTIAVIISDSCCHPGRLGVTAFALVASGIDPLISQIGKDDLLGNPLRLTQEAIADQLATAANAIMGNGDQSTPAAIIRDYAWTPSNFAGWVDGIEPNEDLFRGMFQ